MNRLTDPPYISFPLRIGGHGATTADRRPHVRQQIEQVLFTNPGERVFRPEFGAGLKQLVFEPNSSVLWEITRKRIRRGVFSSVSDLVSAIEAFIRVNNANPKPFVWTKKVDAILEKVARCKAVTVTLH